jgi:hypothetical protein
MMYNAREAAFEQLRAKCPFDSEYITRLVSELDTYGRVCLTGMDSAYLGLLVSLYPEQIPDKLFVYLCMEGKVCKK